MIVAYLKAQYRHCWSTPPTDHGFPRGVGRDVYHQRNHP